MSLKGKSAVVTGSTSGIGLAYARAFAKEGANIVLNGFGDAADIEKERAGIESEFGVKAIYSDSPSSEHVFMRSRQWKQLRPDIFNDAEFDPADFPPAYAHKQMLPANIMLVEHLSGALGELVGQRHEFIAFPAKYYGVEAAPARVAAVIEFP